MSKRKGGSEIKKNERELWTPIMDEALVDAYLRQHELGNRVNGSFTTAAYDNIVAELNEKLGKILDKDKVKNRWKTLKGAFGKCYDLFRDGLTGFGWDSNAKMWRAEPNVWKRLIEARPQAAEWMHKPLPYYERMMTIYGSDQATGEKTQTAKKRRKQVVVDVVATATATSAMNNSVNKTIDDIDRFVSQHEMSIDGECAFATDNFENGDPELHSQSPMDEGGEKSKEAKVNNNEAVIIDAVGKVVASFNRFAHVMEKASAAFVKAFEQPEELLASKLSELDLPYDDMMTAYIFLNEHPEKLKAVVNSTKEMRKDLLNRFVFNRKTERDSDRFGS